jgi:hypothetical protein
MFNWLKNLFKKKNTFVVNGVTIEFVKRGHWIKTNSRKRSDKINQYLIDEGFAPDKPSEGGMPAINR